MHGLGSHFKEKLNILSRVTAKLVCTFVQDSVHSTFRGFIEAGPGRITEVAETLQETL